MILMIHLPIVLLKFNTVTCSIMNRIVFFDAENNFPYFNRVLNFNGTIMVQFKTHYRKTKQSILIEITRLMGVVWYKNSYKI
jgi:hypothetical protein